MSMEEIETVNLKVTFDIMIRDDVEQLIEQFMCIYGVKKIEVI